MSASTASLIFGVRKPVPFKDLHSFEQRKTEASRIRSKYPDRVPVIIERDPTDQDLPEIDKHKFLVPSDLNFGQLLYVIRKRMPAHLMRPDQALFTFVGNQLPPTMQSIGEVYRDLKDNDGFLYVTYRSESTFG